MAPTLVLPAVGPHAGESDGSSRMIEEPRFGARKETDETWTGTPAKQPKDLALLWRAYAEMWFWGSSRSLNKLRTPRSASIDPSWRSLKGGVVVPSDTIDFPAPPMTHSSLNARTTWSARGFVR